MSVEEARNALWISLPADVSPEVKAAGSAVNAAITAFEAAIREETRAHLEASEQRATQWGKENVRLQDELQWAKEMLTEAERQRHFWSRESLRHETQVSALMERIEEINNANELVNDLLRGSVAQVAVLQDALVLIGHLAQEKLGVNFQAIEDICARALSGASQDGGG